MKKSEERYVLAILLSLIIVFTSMWVLVGIAEDKNIENKEGTLNVYTEGKGIKTVYYIKTSDIEPYLSDNMFSSLRGVDKDGIITVIDNSEVFDIEIKNIQDESYITDETFNKISDYKVFGLSDTAKGVIKGSKYIDPDGGWLFSVVLVIFVFIGLCVSIVKDAIFIITNKLNRGV